MTGDVDREKWRIKRNKMISDTPVLMSLLYDLDLLPEQVEKDSHDEWKMDSVVAHVMRLPMTMLPKPPTDQPHTESTKGESL